MATKRPLSKMKIGAAIALLTTSISSAAWADLSGFVDLHTHPATHLAFGRKLIHGVPDVGSLIPADSSCAHNVIARDINHALGTDNSTHGGWNLFSNRCGDELRSKVIDQLQEANGAVVTPDWAGGAPDFLHWPKWNDITHQKMWIDWIRRAHSGGLRVMVALATNNKTLGDAVAGSGDSPTDDEASGDLQITAIQQLVNRHLDFMEVALTPADVRRIVTAGKLAVVLGVELDAFGNFYGKDAAPTESEVRSEITRLRNLGVRYFFPVHTIDNHLGGTAVYKDLFNLSNYREAGQFWKLACSAPASAHQDVDYEFVPQGFDFGLALARVKLGIDPLRNPPTPPVCDEGRGHVNAKGLTALGRFTLRELMKQGMLIDVDHMSQRAVDEALIIATGVPSGGFPLNSGHNNSRVLDGSENARTTSQITKIFQLKGMFGLGLSDTLPVDWIAAYKQVATDTGSYATALTSGFLAIGSDANGLEKGARPAPLSYSASFTRPQTGNKVWDYNVDGMAHYGMLSDFVKSVSQSPGTDRSKVVTGLNKSAEYFARMWEQVEAQRSRAKTTPETLVHQQSGSSSSHEDSYMDYIAGDNKRWCARVFGNVFLLAPNCDWNKARSDATMVYKSWDGLKWAATITGKTFTHALDGDFSESHTDTILNYMSGTTRWTVSLK